MRHDVSLQTSGRGIYSKVAAPVRITKMELVNVYSDGDYGELRVYFDSRSWKVDRDGLIYTDPMFLRLLKQELISMDLPGSSVCYSEQGMQGRNYVSLDTGKRFVNAWQRANLSFTYTDTIVWKKAA